MSEQHRAEPAQLNGPVPLLPADPPRVGDFWLDARLWASGTGVVYLGHQDDKPEAMIIVLSSGAAGDAAARDRFAGEINKLHSATVLARGGQDQDQGRLGYKFRAENDDPTTAKAKPLAPWVSLTYDGKPHALAEAKRILASVDLSQTTPLGEPKGPDFFQPWTRDTRLGNWRLWPTNWPGRHDRAGWMPFLASWLLTMLLAGLGLLIAVLIFQNQPPETPPPPFQSPSSQDSSSSQPSQSGSSSGEPSQSQSSEQSASPSESQSSEQASPSPSDSANQSFNPSPPPSSSPSMMSSGTASGDASNNPSPINTRL